MTPTPNVDSVIDPIHNRSRLFPIQHSEVWDLYKKALAAFWVPDEVDLSDDITHFRQMDDPTKKFILTILAFFANSDIIVNINLDDNFTEKVQILEYKFFLHFQAAMEDIHTTMYQMLIDTYVQDQKQKDELFEATLTIPSIKKKADWATRWTKEGSFLERLVAFACVEGIFFPSSFCAIFWLKKQGKMPGLTHSNELIARDEGLHRNAACLIYSNYTSKLDEKVVVEIVRSAVDIELEFVKECLPIKLIGMNEGMMADYVRLVADNLLDWMGIEKIYKVDNPFPWMDLIMFDNKKNFFERKVSQYAKRSNDNNEQNRFALDADF